MISPNCSETIQIEMVESESDFLLQAFESLGQDALGRPNDLFLIQSCSVKDSFRKQHEFPTGLFKKESRDQAIEVLLQTGAGVASYYSDIELCARHLVVPTSNVDAGIQPLSASHTSLQAMSKEQLVQEVLQLREKVARIAQALAFITAEWENDEQSKPIE
jgi:hypothetical protein